MKNFTQLNYYGQEQTTAYLNEAEKVIIQARFWVKQFSR